MTVALVKHSDHPDPVAAAIEMCDGLRDLAPGHRVLIKPNLVIGGKRGAFPPFGRVTTAHLMEKLIRLLQAKGCRHIAIGEGTGLVKALNSDTPHAFKFAGMDRIARQYGVALVDFERGPFVRLEMDGHKFSVVQAALEADFLINFPVLKTHAQTVVSLGMKNLKGCLRYPSKKRFHKLGNLPQLIAVLNTHVRSHLILIDGTYGLSNGPLFGTAHRWDVVVAGTDILETEMVGAALQGKNPAELAHIVAYAGMTGRRAALADVAVKGRSVDELAMDLPWRANYNRPFERFGLKGIRVASAPADTTICSGCIAAMEYPNHMFAKDNPGLDVGGLEICLGEGARPDADAARVALLGDCAIKHNRDLAGAAVFAGCPPDMTAYFKYLMTSSLPPLQAQKQLAVRVCKMLAFKLGLFKEDYGYWAPYDAAEFDLNLYR
jgi:uncharacterized protein (DUF362 family)